MQVFPTAPSPTVTHLMNLAAAIFSDYEFDWLNLEGKEVDCKGGR